MVLTRASERIIEKLSIQGLKSFWVSLKQAPAHQMERNLNHF
jgi:hypothetical protein